MTCFNLSKLQKILVISFLAGGSSAVQAADFQVRLVRHGLLAPRVDSGGEPSTVPLTRTLSVSPAMLNLGSVPVGQASQPRAVVLTNNGTGIVKLTAMTLSPAPSDFKSTTSCTESLAAGASCQIYISMHPSMQGPREASLNIESDAQAALQAVQLSGTGTAPVFAAWSMTDRGANLIPGANQLVVTSDGTNKGWQVIRANMGKSSGKYVFEMKASTASANLASGFADSTSLLASQLGMTGISVGFTATGYANASQATGKGNLSYSTTTILFALDLTTGRGWIAQSGRWKKGNPETDTDPSFTWAPGTTIYPAASVNTNYGYGYTANFGGSSFTNPVPAGFHPGWY